MTKLFNCCEVFRNHFNYIYQVDDNKNRCRAPISVERNCSTKYWPDRCHAYFLAFTAVNANYLRGYLVNGVDVDTQLDLRRQLGWKMVEKKLGEDTETLGVDARRLRQGVGPW